MSIVRSCVSYLVLGASLAGSAAPAALAEPAATLRWSLKAGDSLHYEFHQTNEIKIKAGDQETNNTTDLTIDISWKVKTVAADGAADLVMVINRVHADIEAGPQKIKFDTKDKDAKNDNPALQALSAVYGPAVGQEYTLKIDARGTLLNAQVPEKVTTALQGSPFLAMADGGSVLSELGLKNLFAQATPILPEKPVAVGDSWPIALEIPVKPLKMTLAIKHTLATLDAATAKVDSTIETTLKPDPGTPFTVNVKEQKGSGSYTLDRKTGRVSASNIDLFINLNLEVMDREIQQSIKTSQTLKLIP